MKKHYLALDWLRGISAISVVMIHLSDCFSNNKILPHAALAVDFFFALSGFVISYAYDERIMNGLVWTTFMQLRLKRLLPLVVAGVLAGAFYVMARNYVEPERSLSAGYLFIAGFFGILLLPISIVTGAEAFPLNFPSWSLFFELLANLLYALLGRRLSTITLGFLIATSAVGICIILYCSRDVHSAYIGFIDNYIVDGSARVGFSFFTGVALFRLRNHRYVMKIPALNPLIGGMILVCIFAVPTDAPIAYEPFIILGVFPLILLASAKCQLAGWTAVASKFGGWLSYPIYAVHVPVALLTMGTLKYFYLYDALPRPWLGIVVISVVITAAFFLGKFYDEPVRGWLLAHTSVPPRVRT